MGCSSSAAIQTDFKFKRRSTVVLPPLETNCQTIAGHVNSVTQIILLNDGRIASCSWDGTVKIWSKNMRTSEETFYKNDEPILSIAQLPDGTILSASADSLIYRWEFDHTSPVQIYKGHSDAVYHITLLIDDEFASCSEDTYILLWKESMPRYIAKLSGHCSKVNKMIVLSTGELVSCSNDCSIKVWDCFSKKCMVTLDSDSCCMTIVELTNGDIAAGYMSKEVKIWNVKKKVVVANLVGHTRQEMRINH